MATENPHPENLSTQPSPQNNRQGPPLGTLALVGGGILLLVILGVVGTRSGNSDANNAAGNQTAQKRTPAPPLIPENEARRALPNDAGLRQLVKNTLLDWNVCVQKRDFTTFLNNNAAQQFRNEHTSASLRKEFAPFIQQNIDISAIKTFTPVMQPLQIDDNGILTLTGYYPTSPSRVSYSLRYILENKKWKSITVSVSLT